MPETDDPGTLVGEIEKNARDRVRVYTRRFKGYDLVDMRVWFEPSEGDIRPTAKGLSIRREQLPELVKILQGALCQEVGA